MELVGFHARGNVFHRLVQRRRLRFFCHSARVERLASRAVASERRLPCKTCYPDSSGEA